MILNVVCSSVLLLLLLTQSSFADEHFPFLGQISRGPVNVRSGANTNFDIVAKLTQGESIVVLAKSYEWYKIQIPAFAAVYVRADYIIDIGQHGGEIVGSKVNVRSKPDSNASILGQLAKGDIVRLSKKVNDWWQIEPPSGAFAWVHASFVSVKSSSVPSEEIRKPLNFDAFVPTKNFTPSVAPIPFHVQGVLQVLNDALIDDVHYKVVANGSTLCYLKDASGIDRFKTAVVSVDGFKDDSFQTLSFPVVRINKISLVL